MLTAIYLSAPSHQDADRVCVVMIKLDSKAKN